MSRNGPGSVGPSSASIRSDLQRLVRTEQRLHRSQRELERQLDHIARLARFAVDAARSADVRAIMLQALSLVFDLYPYEQAIVLVPHGNVYELAAYSAVPGREPATTVSALPRLVELVGHVPAEPKVGERAEIVKQSELVGAAITHAESLFTDGEVVEVPCLALPLPELVSGASGLIVARRSDAVYSAHEQFPKPADTPFLRLVGQQVAVALTNAQLVDSLRRSYGELARAQEELVQRERLAAIGELSAVVAHEVRNPLGAIFNSLATLKRIAQPKESVGVLLDIVREEASRLNRIVDDLLDFARPIVPSLRPEALPRLVTAAVETVRGRAEERSVEIEIDVKNVDVVADARMVHQALTNLLVNAIEQTPPGDCVRLAGFSSAEDTVCIEVTDAGPGVAPENLSRVFEPFFTTKATGTGLGLAVVKRFVEAQGGSVTVRSGPDVPTAFSIYLPEALPDVDYEDAEHG